MKKYKKISCLCLIIGSLIFTSFHLQYTSPDVYAEELVDDAYGVVEKAYSGSSEVLATSDGKTLLLDAKNFNISLKDDKTGIVVSTRMLDLDGASHTQKSDFVVNYFSGGGDLYAATSTITTSEWAIDVDSYMFYEVENGVGVKYTIGNTTVSRDDFPKQISEERLQTLVLDHLDNAQATIILGDYRLIKGIYYSTLYGDKAVSTLKAKELYNLFYETGVYTAEELAVDNAENGVEVVASKQMVELYVEYTLDNGDLVVRIPTQYLTSLETLPHKGIDVLPYFMTSKDETDGYMFIPDETGALIYLDSTKLSETQYTASFYNGDLLTKGTSYVPTNPTLNMPVFGMKTGNYAIMGIIEEGAEIATLKANIAGSFGSETFSKMSVFFDLLPAQTMNASNLVSYPITLVQDKPYTNDIVVRYSLLTGDDANYVGMAKNYQEYLLENEGIYEKPIEDSASLYVELLGSVEKLNYFIGIPYKASNALTTFTQAEEILTTLQAGGVENIKVEYAGIANGGLSADKLTTVSIESVLGGSSGLKKLMSFATQSNIQIFPKFNFQTVDDNFSVKTNEHAYYISGQVAEVIDYEPILFETDSTMLHRSFLVRGSYLPQYVTAFHKSFSKQGITTISAPDIFNDYVGSYKKGKNELPSDNIPSYHEATNFLSENYTLILSNPINEAYRYADYLTDIPIENSGIRILDTYVPFMQLVFNGIIDYSTPVLNDDNNDISSLFMNAIESRSSLKFRLTYAESTALQNSDFDKIFLTHYEQWEDEIIQMYQDYDNFYQLVKDSTIKSHDIINKNSDLRVVKYENGVTVYLNYSDEKEMIQGVSVEPNSYVIKD